MISVKISIILDEYQDQFEQFDSNIYTKIINLFRCYHYDRLILDLLEESVMICFSPMSNGL